jgi:hypothetical protein
MPAAPTPQPFKNHPVPFIGFNTLATSPSLLKGAVGGDFLLVPPPSAANVDANGGSVQRFFAFASIRNAGSAPTAAVTDVQLIYKAESGLEVLLANLTAAVFTVGETQLLGTLFSAPILLAPTDRGIFLRVTGAIAGLAIDAQTFYSDVRGPVRAALDVTAVDPAVAPAGGNPALAQTLLTQAVAGSVSYPGISLPVHVLVNFDTVAHKFHVYLTDGTSTIELTNTASPVPVAPNTVVPLSTLCVVPALAPGWSVKISLAVVGVAVRAPRVITGYTQTNETPARNDQAGAY